MKIKGLYHRLIKDLEKLKLPVNEVDIYFRPFSKTYYGRYFPVYKEGRPKIFMYPYEEDGSYMPYSLILKYTVHEMCHHLQYVDTSFVRLKGVMHDCNFWKLFNHYMSRAIKKGVINEEEIEKCAV